MKDFFKWFGIFALAAVSGFSITTCDNGSTSGPDPNVYILDISGEIGDKNIPTGITGWDYMVFTDSKNDPGLIFDIDEETDIPSRLYVRSNKDSDNGVTFTFKENGLPDRMIVNGYIYLFENFNGYQYDMAIIQPDDTGYDKIQYVYDVQTDVNWDEFNDLEAYRSRLSRSGRSVTGSTGFWLDIAGKAIGVASCAVTAASMLAPPAAAAAAPTLGPMCVSFLITEGINIAAIIVSKVWGNDLPKDIADLLTNAYGCKDAFAKNVYEIAGGVVDCASLLVNIIDIIFKEDEKLVDDNTDAIDEAKRTAELAQIYKNNPLNLFAGVWKDTKIPYNDPLEKEMWFYFNVGKGTTYNILWDDSKDGSKKYTLDLRVSAQYEDGTSIFANVDTAYKTPQKFTANKTGKVKIRVFPNRSGTTGTYAIKYEIDTNQPGTENNPIKLTSYSWKNDSIEEGGLDTKWYSFNAVKGKSYTIRWSDSNEGFGSDTADTVVSAWYGNRGNKTFLEYDAAGRVFLEKQSGYNTPQTFTADRTGIVKIRIYAMGSTGTGYGTYAVLYSENELGSEFNPILLTPDIWTSGEIKASDTTSTKWYYFNAENRVVHNIWWSDSSAGSGTHTLRILVSAYYENGTNFFENGSNAYDDPRKITPTQAGIVKLKVVPRYNVIPDGPANRTGTFALTYSTKSPVVRPSFTNAVPKVPTNVKVTDSTSTSITIQWNAVPDADGYRLYQVTPQGAYNLIDTFPTPGANLLGLKPNSSYTISVSAFNSIGEGSRSSPLTVKTKP